MTQNESNELLEEYCYPTLFGDAEVLMLETDDGDAVRVLYVGGGFQSASYIDERRFDAVFEYIKAFDIIYDIRPIDHVLMIGGGAFSYPKHMLTHHESGKIDVVEIDPAVVDIARKHFYLDELEGRFASNSAESENRLRSIVADGSSFLAQAAASHYDVIINDSYNGTNLTQSLLSDEQLLQAKQTLKKDGLYLINVSIDTEDDENDLSLETASAAASALAQHFDYVWHVICVDEEYAGADNYLLIASDFAWDVPGGVQL